MLITRSRAGVAGVSTGAIVLLAVPVVALGQVPGVDQVVGGVTETAATVVQLSAAPAPTVPAPAAAPPTAAPPAPALRGTTTSSEPAGPGGSASVPSGSAAPAARPAGGDGAHARSAQDQNAGAPEDEGDTPATTTPGEAPAGSDDRLPRSDTTPNAAGESASGADANDDDSARARLPFSGLQLALLAMIGMASLASGGGLRRHVREQRA